MSNTYPALENLIRTPLRAAQFLLGAIILRPVFPAYATFDGMVLAALLGTFLYLGAVRNTYSSFVRLILASLVVTYLFNNRRSMGHADSPLSSLVSASFRTAYFTRRNYSPVGDADAVALSDKSSPRD